LVEGFDETNNDVDDRNKVENFLDIYKDNKLMEVVSDTLSENLYIKDKQVSNKPYFDQN